MAKFKKEILGKVNGALGDITFRQRNGKTYLSTRPDSFIPGNDPASVARREKFSLSIKLAKNINKIHELKEAWDQDAPQGTTTFNHIMRSNYPMIDSNDLSGIIKLVPTLGFHVSNPAVTLGPDVIKVDLDAIGSTSGIIAASEPSLKLISIVYLSSPVDNLVGKNSFIKFISASQDVDLANALEFSFTLSDVETQMFAKYQNIKGFFVLVSLDADGNVVHYSNTFNGK